MIPNYALVQHPASKLWHYAFILHGMPWVSATGYQHVSAAEMTVKVRNELKPASKEEAEDIITKCTPMLVAEPTPRPPTHRIAVCPKCDGSGRRPYAGRRNQDGTPQYILAGYRAEDDTLACDNFGGQTMSRHALGETRVDPRTGIGCWHEFMGRNAGRCYHIYTCQHCGLSYDIDSGD